MKLTGRAARWYNLVLGEFDLNSGESELVLEAARTIELLDRLYAEMKDQPLMVPGSRPGMLVANGLLSEIRGARATLLSYVRALQLPDVEDETPRTTADGRKVPMSRHESARKAAAARWSNRGTA